MGRVYLVRHGETGWNAEGRFAGRIRRAPDDAGIAQADALAGRLLHPPTAVYSSPLQRAAQTAEAVAAAHGLRVHCKDGLRDMGFGDWEGKTFDEIAESTPGALGAVEAQPPHDSCASRGDPGRGPGTGLAGIRGGPGGRRASKRQP